MSYREESGSLLSFFYVISEWIYEQQVQVTLDVKMCIMAVCSDLSYDSDKKWYF